MCQYMKTTPPFVTMATARQGSNLSVQHMHSHTTPGDTLGRSQQKKATINVHCVFKMRSHVQGRGIDGREVCNVGKLPHQLRTGGGREGGREGGRNVEIIIDLSNQSIHNLHCHTTLTSLHCVGVAANSTRWARTDRHGNLKLPITQYLNH